MAGKERRPARSQCRGAGVQAALAYQAAGQQGLATAPRGITVTEHRFSVVVEVRDEGHDWAHDPYGRTAEQYAEGALWAASLRDAAHLDGFADLPSDATITWLELER
jgi:hypothetical protein